MYLYFNRNGVLKEIISDAAVREGSYGYDKVYVYFENDAVTSATANIKFSNDTTVTVTLTREIEEQEIPDEITKYRDLKYFKAYVPYQFYSFVLGNTDSNNPPVYSLINGLTEMSISAVINASTVQMQGLVVFMIENSTVVPDTTITEADFQYLLNAISNKEDLVNKTSNPGNSTTLYVTQNLVKLVDITGKTYAETLQFITDGKVPYYYSGNDLYVYNEKDVDDNLYFSFFEPNSKQIYVAIFTENIGPRVVGYFTIEQQENKSNTLTDSETQYPTTHAVKSVTDSLTTSLNNIKNAYVVSAEIVQSGEHKDQLHLIYKITSGGITSTQDLYFKGSQIVYLTTSDLTQITYEQIKALLDDGNLPIIKDTSSNAHNTYYLMYDGNNSYVFASVDYTGNFYDKTGYLYIREGQVNDIREYEGENKNNKVNSITNSNKTSMTEYPSIKAIVDYIEQNVGSAVWGNITGTLSDQTDLQNALNDKVDKVEGSSLMTSTEHDKLSGIESGAEVNVLEGVQINNNDLTITNKKVNIAMDTTFNPSSTNAAQSQAIANFVNSSINSNTAYFLGTYNLVSDLSGSISDTHSDVGNEIETYFQNHPPVGGISNNDYVFIQIPTADNTPTIIAQIDRYKYNSEDEEWLYEYTLNNSGFTAAQWAAINSGIDATKVSTYDGYATTKQDTLISGTNIKTMNGNSVLGSGNITTYAEFVDTWVTTLSSTVLAFCQQVNGTASAVVGTAYLGTVSFSDMPTGVSNGELVVEIIPSSAATNGKAIHLILTSGSIAPYRWEYTYWEQNSTDHYTGWIGFQNQLIAGNNISIAGNTISAVSSSTNKFVTAEMYSWLQDQLYQKPTIQTYYCTGTIDGGQSQNVSDASFTTYVETGSTVIITHVIHKETNIQNIETNSLKFNGTEIIEPKADATQVQLSSPITFTTTTSFVLGGIDTRGNTFQRTCTTNFTNYVYTCVSSSTTTPTTGLTKKVRANATTDQFNISYAAGDYIYFYHTSSGKHVQQYSLGQWNNVPQTDLGQVTITKANNTTGTYYAYRVGAFTSGGTDTFRIA